MKTSKKKILFFAPAATKENPAMCPFVTQRIFELQKNGYEVIVLQHGMLFFLNSLKVYRKGALQVIEYIYRFLQIFFRKKNVFISDYGQFIYYNSLTFISSKSFYRWYRRNNFQFINAHFIWCAEKLPKLKQMYNIPYTVTIHGSDIHEVTLYDKEKIDFTLNVLSNANKCIFISKYLLQHAKSIGFRGDNSVVIYNGYNKELFYLNTNQNRNKTFIIGFVGHPIFIKRADILPIVLKIVKEKIPNVKLLMVGVNNTDFVSYIKLQACELGLKDDIEMIPPIPPEQVGEYMRKMDVLLFPSRNEGFGCVAIEAQACGVGVIASSNGGIPEAIFNDSICVPETENFIHDFAYAIIRYLKTEHNAKDISESVKDYTWENCVKKEIEIFQRII